MRRHAQTIREHGQSSSGPNVADFCRLARLAVTAPEKPQAVHEMAPLPQRTWSGHSAAVAVPRRIGRPLGLSGGGGHARLSSCIGFHPNTLNQNESTASGGVTP